jgi:hypothetical protein
MIVNTDGTKTPGAWPDDFPISDSGRVQEGLIVLSLSGTIEGRTTGARRPCISDGCGGWFITVRWQTGQLMHICSEGWGYEPSTSTVRVTGGGEISARFVSPRPFGVPPLPRHEWPSQESLAKGRGWRRLP